MYGQPPMGVTGPAGPMGPVGPPGMPGVSGFLGRSGQILATIDTQGYTERTLEELYIKLRNLYVIRKVKEELHRGIDELILETEIQITNYYLNNMDKLEVNEEERV